MTDEQLQQGAASFIQGGRETGALIRATDWATTPLGPPGLWPQSLRTTINMCVNSRFPIAVYWGPQFLMLYNEFADDNADMRQYVSRLLGERWNVETAANGVEALAAIRCNPPNLLVCDVMMPGMDGFALVAALRGDEAFRTLPMSSSRVR